MDASEIDDDSADEGNVRNELRFDDAGEVGGEKSSSSSVRSQARITARLPYGDCISQSSVHSHVVTHPQAALENPFGERDRFESPGAELVALRR